MYLDILCVCWEIYKGKGGVNVKLMYFKIKYFGFDCFLSSCVIVYSDWL